MVLIITVQEAYGHCAKAILRGKIWEKNFRQSSADVPGLTELMTHHLDLKEEDVVDVDTRVINDIKDSMY